MRIEPRIDLRIVALRGMLLLSGLVLAACRDHAETGTAAASPLFVHNGELIQVPDKSELRAYLVVAPVQEQTVQVPLSAPAVLEVDPARVANILPPVAGRIGTLLVHLGDTIKAGQPLLTIDSADLAQARADLQHAQITLTQTKKALAREQDLSDHHIAAQKDLEQAQADFGSAQSEYQRASAVFRVLGISPESTDSPRQLTVRSPLSGRVSMLNAAPGAYANDSNAALMTVSDASTIWFTGSVQEKDLAAVSVGENIAASVQAFPGETFKGKVKFIADQLDADTRTVKVRVAYDNADGQLKPGMFATLNFLGAPRSAIMVPTTSLIQQGSHTLVYVEVSAWTFQPREVTSGAQLGNDVEVLNGLKAGERVVTRQAVLLND